MMNSIELLRLLIVEHQSLQYLIVFIGTVFGGEFALFALGFFIAQGILPVLPSLILGFLGAFTPNILWFLLSKTDITSKIMTHRRADSTVSIITEAVTKISGGNHFIALALIKFLIGTPILLTMYINKTSIRFINFLYYETPAILLSLLVIIPIGFFSGLGFFYLADVFNNFYVAIGFILIIIVVITILQIRLKVKFVNLRENL